MSSPHPPSLIEMRQARLAAENAAIDANAQRDKVNALTSAGEQLLQERQAHDEKVRKETQRMKEKAAAQAGQGPTREPGLGESGNPEPILEAPQPMNPSQIAGGPTLSPAMANNYGEPGGPQPGSPGQQGGASANNYGGPSVPPYLVEARSTEGPREIFPGIHANQRTVQTTARPNVLSAYEGASLGQQQMEMMARERIAQQQLTMERNKTYLTSFKDLAPEVGPELATLISEAASTGDMDRVLALTEGIPETTTGRLLKAKIRTETARQSQLGASAAASMAAAANSRQSAAKTGEERLDMLLQPYADALANPQAMDPNQHQALVRQIITLPPAMQARLTSLGAAATAKPLSSAGKAAADFNVDPGSLTDDERRDIVTGAGKTTIDLGLAKTTQTKVDEVQLQVSRARDSLERTRSLFDESMAGLGARSASGLTAFARDKAGLPVVPTIANFGAQLITGKSKQELDAWYEQRNKALSSAGRETAYVINDLFGTAVNEREDKRAQQFVNELQSGDPDRIMVVLGEAQVYANMKLASYALWDKGGKVGKPWDIPDSRVVESMATAFDHTYKELEQSNPQYTPNVIKMLSLQKIERFYGLSNGMAFTLMKEYNYGR